MASSHNTTTSSSSSSHSHSSSSPAAATPASPLRSTTLASFDETVDILADAVSTNVVFPATPPPRHTTASPPPSPSPPPPQHFSVDMRDDSDSSAVPDDELAPTDFDLGTGSELLNDDVCTMCCPTCTRSRRSYHCARCVQAGNFVLSSGRSAPAGGSGSGREPFAEKRARYQQLQRQCQQLAASSEQLLAPRRQRELQQAELRRAEQRTALMRAEVAQRRAQLERSRELQQRLQRSIAEARKKFPQFENNVENLRQFVDDRLAQNGRLEARKAELQRRLQQRVRRLVGCLVTYVFPVTQVMSMSTDSGTGTGAAVGGVHEVPEHVAGALAEATRTAYVHGRWILQDSHHEMHHVVVAPTLPGNGDYSAYVDWLALNRDGVPGGSGGGTAASTAAAAAASSGMMAGGAELVTTSQNDAYRIAGALTYTTQLVMVLAYYLDAHMPFRMNYGDFCNKELTAATFQRKVARLNGNILALCYSQNVRAQQLVATHTLANLQQLINARDLGRIGAVNGSNSLVVDVSHLNSELQAGDNSDTDDETQLVQDWEAVPDLPAHETFADPLPSASYQTGASTPPTPSSLLSMTTAQTTSMAGGLVNGAVASVSSLWRGFTRR